MKTIWRSLAIALIVLLICVAGFSGYRIYAIYTGYNESKRIYAGISKDYVSYAPAQQRDDVDDKLSSADSSNGGSSEESSPLTVDFNELKSNLNPEIIGWLWCQDTVIDYPVVQHSDNEYYLNYNVNGEQSANGAIFLETANFSDFRDINNILHGHHMGDGSMFASLDRWQVTDYLEKHPIMYLNTPSCNYRIDIFSGFTTPANSKAYQYEFSSISDVRLWLDWIQGESLIHPAVDVSPTDRYLTMSTCAYSYDDARTVLIGRLTPIAS